MYVLLRLFLILPYGPNEVTFVFVGELASVTGRQMLFTIIQLLERTMHCQNSLSQPKCLHFKLANGRS